MVDIDDIINRLLEHPAKELFYSISKGKFLDVTASQVDYESDMDLCSFSGAKKCWETARKTFMGKRPGTFPELPSTCPAKKWNSLVKENGLEKEWFTEFRLALAENVTKFSEFFGVSEVEAEPELYLEIKKELLAFEAKHYEKKYCDMVLFCLSADYEGVPMTILGNAGTVFGVSFYPSDIHGDNFLLIQNQESLGIDSGTANAISTMVSFYFEKEPLPYSFIKDPYESNDHLSSAYLCSGTLMRSYLPKSIALRALNYLKCANEEMAKFASSRKGKLRDNCFYNVFLEEGKARVCESDPYEMFDGHLPYNFESIHFLDVPLRFKKGGSFDATIKYLPGYITKPDEDERILSFTFIAILCDHESGYIHIHSLGQATTGHPFDSLVESLSKDLQGIVLPKTIYVNNYLDFAFFRAFFAPYISKGKVKVEIAKEELTTDLAYDSLVSFLGEQVEEEGEGINQKPLGEA